MSYSVINATRSFIQGRFNTWLKKRIPAAKQHALSNKNIFIFPTRFGFSYLFFVFVLFLLATNYQNNIIMLLSYLLASLFISVMMTSFFNLSGLNVNVNSLKPSEGFVKQLIYFSVNISSNSVSSSKRFNAPRRFSLNFTFDSVEPFKSKSANPICIPLLSNTIIKVDVPCLANNRGLLYPGRLKISSEYCFGLFTTWTHLDFDFQGIVFPKPKEINSAHPSLLSSQENDESLKESVMNNSLAQKGSDEFYEFKNYVQGEAVSRIAWKQLAKGQGKLTKHYQKSQQQACWLTLSNMPANTLEIKLEMMCFLILEYENAGIEYGVDLGNIKINPSYGMQHQQECLTALALHY